MLGNKAVLLNAVFAGNDSEFTDFFAGWLEPMSLGCQTDDDWVLVAMPVALDTRHTHCV